MPTTKQIQEAQAKEKPATKPAQEKSPVPATQKPSVSRIVAYYPGAIKKKYSRWITQEYYAALVVGVGPNDYLNLVVWDQDGQTHTIRGAAPKNKATHEDYWDWTPRV